MIAYAFLCTVFAADDKPFRLRVYDEATGRGVPLVEVEALTNQKWITDSNGLVAISDPVLMNRTAFFYIRSHGYEFKKDGFGFAGTRIDLKPGGKIDIPIKRINIAERLYRVTGGGIYRHTIALGEKAPIKQPLLNAQVLGSDSVQMTPYKGKLYWFWGDTKRPSYPLGNFHTPGATSLLPGKGGLDPDVGVDLEYFTDKDGFAKGTAKMPGDGPTWVTGVMVRHWDPDSMYASYAKIKNQLEVYERGFARWDDKKQSFVDSFALNEGIQTVPSGHSIRIFARWSDRNQPLWARESKDPSDPFVTIAYTDPAPLAFIQEASKALHPGVRLYSFDCLTESSWSGRQEIERDEKGRPKYRWNRKQFPGKSQPLNLDAQFYNKLVKEGKLKPDEVPLPLRDPDTGKRFTPHAGSTVWNYYRQKWVMVTTEIFGTSMLGELWYAEADSPVGPWVYARKVLTHEKYSFYNPKLHQVFFKDNGRIVYFEGTYTTLFSGNSNPTPDYDYNQIMYRMNVDDPRLNLPTPIYDTENTLPRFVTKNGLSSNSKGRAPFCALDRPSAGTKPAFFGDGRLALDKPPTNPTDRSCLVFYALPPDASKLPASAVALHERFDEANKCYVYTVRKGAPVENDDKHGKRIMFVWENPKADEPTLRAEEVLSWKDATPQW